MSESIELVLAQITLKTREIYQLYILLIVSVGYIQLHHLFYQPEHKTTNKVALVSHFPVACTTVCLS